jgi:peroxiredoxin Q/BCP
MSHNPILWSLIVVGTTIGISLSVPRGASGAELAVGDAAPDFTLSGTDGTQHKLRDMVGKQAVVIAWFPKAFTPG